MSDQFDVERILGGFYPVHQRHRVGGGLLGRYLLVRRRRDPVRSVSHYIDGY